MLNYLNIKIISIVVTVLLLIGGVAFYFSNRTTQSGDPGGGFLDTFFPTSEEKPGTAVIPTPTPQAPGAGNIETATDKPLGVTEAQQLPIGTLIRLTDEAISSIAPTALGTVKYHKNIPESLGHLFERKPDGSNEEKKLSNFTIPQVLKIVWAPNTIKAVVFYNVGGNVRKILVDYSSSSTPKTTFLLDSVSDVTFSPDSKSIAFINDLGSTRNIFVATSDNKNPKKIADNNIPDLEISWPAAGTLALKTKSSYAFTGYLYSVAVSNGSLTKIAEGLGLDAVWSYDGTGVLISTVNSGGQIQPVKYLNTKTQTIKEFSVNTIAEKCIFLRAEKNNIYCAAPRAFSAARYPDAWWQGTAFFEDDLALLNITDASVSIITTTPTDITNPQLLANDSYLIFEDKNTSFLWSVKLK